MSNEKMGVDLGVRRLIGLYANHVDGRNLDKALALFTPEASIDVNGEAQKGHDGIRGWLEMLFKSPPGIHLTTNTVVDFDPVKPGLARARSDVAFIRKQENGWTIMAAGRYVDTCELRNGNWLFASRTIEIS